jgi:hypothetical protein
MLRVSAGVEWFARRAARQYLMGVQAQQPVSRDGWSAGSTPVGARIQMSLLESAP